MSQPNKFNAFHEVFFYIEIENWERREKYGPECKHLHSGPNPPWLPCVRLPSCVSQSVWRPLQKWECVLFSESTGTDKGRPVCPFHWRPVENSLSAPCQGAWPCEAGLRRNAWSGEPTFIQGQRGFEGVLISVWIARFYFAARFGRKYCEVSLKSIKKAGGNIWLWITTSKGVKDASGNVALKLIDPLRTAKQVQSDDNNSRTRQHLLVSAWHLADDSLASSCVGWAKIINQPNYLQRFLEATQVLQWQGSPCFGGCTCAVNLIFH